MTYGRQHKSKRAIICSFLLQRLSWAVRGGECWPVIRESTRMAMRRIVSCLVLPRLLSHPHPPVHYTHRDLPDQTRHQQIHQPSTSRYRRNHIPKALRGSVTKWRESSAFSLLSPDTSQSMVFSRSIGPYNFITYVPLTDRDTPYYSSKLSGSFSFSHFTRFDVNWTNQFRTFSDQWW